jgi:hypothetical protein
VDLLQHPAWVIGSVIPNLTFMVFGGPFSHQLAAYVTLGAFIQTVVGIVAGATLYKELPVPAQVAVAVAV